MIDRIRDRQRQIASLRAFGLSSAVVRRSVRIETGIIALTGMLIGVACGVLLAWRVGHTRAFATAANSFSIPLVPLLAAIAIVLVASILAANAAARRASRLQPAHALRFDE
jgi:putative ABC transport system permease protein